METPRHGTATSLAGYLGIIRRRWILVLIPLLIVPLAAVGFSMQQQKLFQATTKVLITDPVPVQNVTQTNVPTDPTRRSATEVDVATVPEVAQRTLDAVGLHDRSALDLLSETSVSAASDADILNFSVTDPRPGVAKRLVNEYAKQYIAYRKELDTQVVRGMVTDLRNRIDQLQRTIDGQPSPDPSLRDQLRSLLDSEQNLQTLEQLQGGTLFIIRPADSAAQVQPRTIRNGLIGVVLGLIAGLGLAFLAHALDTRVRSAEEVAQSLGLPLLGRVPAPPASLARKNRLAMLAKTQHSHAESYRTLRTAFDLANLRLGAKTVIVTSALDREGKSTTLANLAIALTRSGRSVALVDLDLRRPRVAAFFGLEGRPGVTEVAIGGLSLDDALAPIAIDAPASSSVNGHGELDRTTGGLDVLPSGLAPGDAAEFLSTPELAAIMAELRDRFDLVLVDAPPILPVSDALTLSAEVDAMLIVVRAGVVRRNVLGELRRVLDSVPTAKLGFVLTGADIEDGYGYGAGYGYASAPKAEPRTQEKVRT